MIPKPKYWVERCGTVGAVAICSKYSRHVFRSWEACKQSKWPFWHQTCIPEDIHVPVQVTVTPRQGLEMVLIDDPLKVQCVDPHKLEVAVAWARSRGWCGKIVWDSHMNANDCKDNAARKWYYETQVQPRWKKESK